MTGACAVSPSVPSPHASWMSRNTEYWLTLVRMITPAPAPGPVMMPAMCPPAAWPLQQPGARVALVEQHDEDPVRSEPVDDPGGPRAEEAVAGRGGAVVHVVTQVGRDPCERRQRSVVEIRRQLSERHHVVAAIGVVADVGVVHERVVLHRVRAGVRLRSSTDRGSTPCMPSRRSPHARVDRRCSVPSTKHVVQSRGDAVRAARRQCEVVGQARMRDREEPAQRDGAARERPEVGRARVRGHDRVGLTVLEHHHDDVLRSGGRRARRGDRRRRRSLSGGVQRQERGGEHRRTDPHQWNGM